MDVELPTNAIVVRFTPITPEGLVRSANRAFQESGHYRVSVFADTPRPEEDLVDVLRRLFAAADLSQIDPERNDRFFLCARSGDITQLGFTFVKDGYDGEVPEHWSVDLGSAPTLEQAAALRACFETTARRRSRA